MSARGVAFDFRRMIGEIQKAGALRGLVLTMQGQIVTREGGQEAPEIGELVNRLQAAWAATDGQPAPKAHVAQMIAAIAKNAAERRGAVEVSRTAWVLICSYANSGRPPKRED